MSHSISPYLVRRQLFISSLGIIITVISFFETLVMCFFEVLSDNWGIVFAPLPEAALDTGLLTLLSTPCLWFFSLRPLAVRIEREQSKVEEQTRVNAELRVALDTHALVSIADHRGRIIHVNDKFCATSGYSPEELIGQDHRIVNSGQHDKRFIRNLWETITAGQVWQGEICNRTKEGQLYWVDSTIMPLLDPIGHVRQYISIRRDVTVQKNNELKLLKLQHALEASNEMILITDADGAIQYVNPALCQFTGWSETELIGQRCSTLNSPNVDPVVQIAMQTALGRGEPWSGLLLNRRRGRAPIRIAGQSLPPDALEYWAELNITPVLTKEGALSGYIQIQRDASENVARDAMLQLEKEDAIARFTVAEVLQQSQPIKQRFIGVLNCLLSLKALHLQCKGGVFLKAQDSDGLDLFVLQGNFSEEFIRREQRIPLGACLCGRAAVAGKPIVSDDCFCDPRHEHQFDGMQAHGHYIIPIATGEAVLGVLFLYTDPYPAQSESRMATLTQVSEMMALALLQEQAKAALELSRDAALQAAVTKSEFLANMSHEIRTPMNGVLGMLDLLKDTELSREQWDLLETAANSAEALLDIINDILDFSKLEAGKFELEAMEFNLPALVEEVCALMAGRAHAKGLDLNCFVPAHLPQRWLGDPTRIRQVLTNLMGNAIKFTETGEVSLKITELKADQDGARIRIEVLDTGIGMTPEVQARLFQPFSQADSSTSRRFGGTGLGLSISRNLVTLMKGMIGLDSAVGQGTKFWLTLPLMPIDHAVQARLTDLSEHRALIVDDNATNRMILEHHLTHWGLTVVPVDNAAAALDELQAAALRGEPFTLLLSDLHMPDMDGFALMRAINENPAFAALPKLILSSGGLSSEVERKALGISHCLLKPIRQNQLFDAIVEALQTSPMLSKSAVQQETSLSDYHDKRVLVAEDNKVNQKVILAMLARFQIKADWVENGQAVLDQLAQQAYDLVLMDCQMPVMDGYEATRHVRAQELSRDPANATRLPIVALTAHAAIGEREKCLTAGMDDYLSKPIEKDKLATLLAHWLGESAIQKPAVVHETSLQMSDVPAVWDEARVLEQLDGDKALLAEIVALFLNEIPHQLTALSEAYLNNDLPVLADIAHRIKGMAGHFCADTLIHCAATLEHAARHVHLGDFKAMTDDLIGTARSLIACLSQPDGRYHGE